MAVNGWVGVYVKNFNVYDGFDYSLLPIGFRRMLASESNVPEVVFDDGKRVVLEFEDRMHEKVQPSADAITAVRHATGLLFGREKELIKLTILRGKNVPDVARHRYHATARREFMLVSGEMETE